MNTLRRLFAFAVGRLKDAEQLTYIPCAPTAKWMTRASRKTALAQYALEAAKRSAEWADAAVQQLQAKASSFLTVVLALIPLGVALTGVGYPARAQPDWRLAAFALFVVGDILLLVAAMLAGMASGLVLNGGTNVGRLEKPPDAFADLKVAQQKAALMAAEARAWEVSAWISMQTTSRVGDDLFQARRSAILAGLSFAVGAILLVVAVNGDLGQIIQ